MNNTKGVGNRSTIGQYNEDVSVMTYGGVVVANKKDLVKEEV